MMGERVKAYPLAAWLFAAMTAPIVHHLADEAWWLILLAGGLCGLLCFCVMVISEGECCRKRWYCIAQLVFLIPVVSLAARWNAECWPTGNGTQEMPLVMIAIAAAAAWNGAERSSRVNGVMFWFVALLYAAVLASGIEDVRIERLVQGGSGGAMAVFVFLIPVTITFLPREGFGKYKWTSVWALVFAVAVSVLTVGTLSGTIAGEFKFPFYEYSKSIKFFGIAQRLESLVSVVITMGYFGLLSLLFSGVWHLTDTLQSGKGKWGIAVAGAIAAAGTFADQEIPAVWLMIAAVVFWGILPLFSISKEYKNRVKKVEKSA